MHTRFVTIVSVSMLALAACGGGSSSGPQGEVADLFAEVAEEQGLELDRDCVDEATARLSDADAQAIVDAGPDGSPDLSDEANAIGDDVFSCVGMDSFIDSMIAEMEDEDVDVDCLRDELATFSRPDEVETAVLMDAMISCSTDG